MSQFIKRQIVLKLEDFLKTIMRRIRAVFAKIFACQHYCCLFVLQFVIHQLNVSTDKTRIIVSKISQADRLFSSIFLSWHNTFQTLYCNAYQAWNIYRRKHISTWRFLKIKRALLSPTCVDVAFVIIF